jgi:MFS family permease
MVNNAKTGIRENLPQFLLLVLINGFVGAMVGMERSIFPEYADTIFGVTSYTAMLSFIAAFGLSKALTNYFTGIIMERFGRKKPLVFGWIIALPVPFLLIYAPSWGWVVFANILLGSSQGMTWSSTVLMKIDLAGEKQRGLAMGLNEFAGYVSVGIFAYLSTVIAQRYGILPYPFMLSFGIALSGLLLSVIFVRDTSGFSKTEAKSTYIQPEKGNLFWFTTIKDRTLNAVTQAGFVNNLNDGMIWGLFPVMLHQLGYNLVEIGMLTAIYPLVWGLTQAGTGILADWYNNKRLLVWGMMLQAVVILILPFGLSFFHFVLLSVFLGLGTALVYPTFLKVISNRTHPLQRSECMGTFRFWRDLGYVMGALSTGFIADIFSVNSAIWLVGFVTLISAIFVLFRMQKQLN